MAHERGPELLKGMWSLNEINKVRRQLMNNDDQRFIVVEHWRRDTKLALTRPRGFGARGMWHMHNCGSCRFEGVIRKDRNLQEATDKREISWLDNECIR